MTKFDSCAYAFKDIETRRVRIIAEPMRLFIERSYFSHNPNGCRRSFHKQAIPFEVFYGIGNRRVSKRLQGVLPRAHYYLSKVPPLYKWLTENELRAPRDYLVPGWRAVLHLPPAVLATKIFPFTDSLYNFAPSIYKNNDRYLSRTTGRKLLFSDPFFWLAATCHGLPIEVVAECAKRPPAYVEEALNVLVYELANHLGFQLWAQQADWRLLPQAVSSYKRLLRVLRKAEVFPHLLNDVDMFYIIPKDYRNPANLAYLPKRKLVTHVKQNLLYTEGCEPILELEQQFEWHRGRYRRV